MDREHFDDDFMKHVSAQTLAELLEYGTEENFTSWPSGRIENMNKLATFNFLLCNYVHLGHRFRNVTWINTLIDWPSCGPCRVVEQDERVFVDCMVTVCLRSVLIITMIFMAF